MAEPKTVRFKLDGRELEAPEGTLLIEAARAAGVEIPHYCYHPALGNPGNCRMCVVEVAGAPKPMVSCRLPVREGLEARAASPAAKRAQASALELHLVNHPLDCPVCDQSGECGLQDYYMKAGLYESQVREDKEHKDKRVPIGPRVMLDQERCILCTRCTRFTEKVTGTRELGIFRRGHEEAVALAPGAVLDNAYSGNVVDLCPVGALTDRDFRYKVRVWYLDKSDTVCPGCSRGCAITLHTSTKRPWHNEGRRVARVKPRLNPEVNGWWICDEGRYGYKSLDEGRLGKVLRLSPAPAELSWEAAAAELAGALREGLSRGGPGGLAVAASGMLSNEDWAAYRSLFVAALGAGGHYFSPEPDQIGEEDALLRRREKVPNLEGARALGLSSTGSFEDLAAAIESGRVWGLWIVERDLARIWGEARTRALLAKLSFSVFQGPNKGGTGPLVGWRLPATAYAEEDGHFTNFQGRVQAYRRALAPVGAALPDWEIFGRVERAWRAAGQDAAAPAGEPRAEAAP